MDEALALPSEKAARIALRTQQVIAHRQRHQRRRSTWAVRGSSNSLTDEMAAQAEAILRRRFSHGWGLDARRLHQGHGRELVPGRIAESAYNLERSFNRGTRVIVGVNDFTGGNETRT